MVLRVCLHKINHPLLFDYFPQSYVKGLLHNDQPLTENVEGNSSVPVQVTSFLYFQ